MGLGNNVNIVIASNYQNMEIIRKMSCCKLALSLTYLLDTQSKIWLNIEAIWQVKLFSLAKEILPIRLTKKSCGFYYEIQQIDYKCIPKSEIFMLYF